MSYRACPWSILIYGVQPGLPEDFDSSMRKVDFVKLSERHEGSRDAGAQMFCALLRSAGVEARLVCSLQALPFATVPHTPTAGKIKQTVVYAGTDSDDQIETGDEGILSSASRPASVNGDATVLATPNESNASITARLVQPQVLIWGKARQCQVGHSIHNSFSTQC